jgi:hypothetical protein
MLETPIYLEKVMIADFRVCPPSPLQASLSDSWSLIFPDPILAFPLMLIQWKAASKHWMPLAMYAYFFQWKPFIFRASQLANDTRSEAWRNSS